MTREELPSEEFDMLMPLDDGAGPALPQPDAALSAAAESAVTAATAMRPAVSAWGKKRMALFAAIVLVPGVSAAFVLSGHTPLGSATAPPKASAPAVSVPRSSQPAPSVEASEVGSRELSPAVPEEEKPDVEEAQASPVQVAISPEDLLQAANRLRSQTRWAEAAQAYFRVVQRYPGSAQASVASLAAASLYLEHLGAPSRALALYQGAVNSPGLAAEAELGIAKCYRAMGDVGRERSTLRRLVKKYPNALFAPRVKRRLEDLGEKKPR